MIDYFYSKCMLFNFEKIFIIRIKEDNLGITALLCEKADKLRFENFYKEAVSTYLNAILIDRNSAEGYFGLGLCYKNLKNYEKAVKYLEIASNLKENYETYYELGVCYQAQGISCGAIKSFIRAIQLKPDSTDAILQLGISHELCEENELALMIYQKLIENSPEFLKAYDQKSSLLMKMGNYKEASSVLNKLLKQNSKHHSAYAGIGVCFEKLGKYAQARRYYRKFLSVNPFSSQKDFIINRLNKIKNTKKINFIPSIYLYKLP